MATIRANPRANKMRAEPASSDFLVTIIVEKPALGERKPNTDWRIRHDSIITFAPRLLLAAPGWFRLETRGLRKGQVLNIDKMRRRNCGWQDCQELRRDPFGSPLSAVQSGT